MNSHIITFNEMPTKHMSPSNCGVFETNVGLGSILVIHLSLISSPIKLMCNSV